jgi:hypothetical protein
MIAVAGATGTIGSELTRLLVAAGADVTALVRDPGRGRARLGPTVPLRVVDLADPATVGTAVTGADTLFLVSSDPALEPGVVDAAVAAGVGRIVKSSAIGFGADPPAGHAAAEQRITDSGARWTVLRPSAFLQTLAGYLPVIAGADGTLELPAGAGAPPSSTPATSPPWPRPSCSTRRTTTPCTWSPDPRRCRWPRWPRSSEPVPAKTSGTARWTRSGRGAPSPRAAPDRWPGSSPPTTPRWQRAGSTWSRTPCSG